jgi:hypothetical protein
MVTALSSEYLAPSVNERMVRLLEKPGEGSMAFRINSPDAKYLSNCHGTMTYVFGLEHPTIDKKDHPSVISNYQMMDLIQIYFMPSSGFEVGTLVGFYEICEDSSRDLIHTALFVGPNDQIFQQSGTGGIFEMGTIDSKLRCLAIGLRGVETISYRYLGN